MTNVFLKVNKDLFKLGLSPIEILLISQVMEFDTNTGDCFISNDKLAEQFGVSVSTIKRALDRLESLGFIERNTTPSQKGKARHMKANISKIDEVAKIKMNLAKDDDNKSAKVKMNLAEGSKCSLRKEQNEPIKDKSEEDNSIKDNLERDGTLQKPFKVSREWLIERHNYLTKLANGVFRYNNQFYIME